MKEYEGIMKTYEENMNKYVKNMKTYLCRKYEETFCAQYSVLAHTLGEVLSLMNIETPMRSLKNSRYPFSKLIILLCFRSSITLKILQMQFYH